MKVTSPEEGPVFTPELQRATEAAPAVQPSAVVSHRLRVLLVDDEPLLRRAFARVLAPQCESVTLAASGEEALSVLEARPNEFDLVLLDLSMPGLTGREVLAQLNARVPSLPVVVLSGHIEARSSLSAAFDVLEKPVSSPQLAVLLGRIHRRG
jgi:CheY-like chemotaxis protein